MITLYFAVVQHLNFFIYETMESNILTNILTEIKTDPCAIT